MDAFLDNLSRTILIFSSQILQRPARRYVTLRTLSGYITVFWWHLNLPVHVFVFKFMIMIGPGSSTPCITHVSSKLYCFPGRSPLAVKFVFWPRFLLPITPPPYTIYLAKQINAFKQNVCLQLTKPRNEPEINFQLKGWRILPIKITYMHW